MYNSPFIYVNIVWQLPHPWMEFARKRITYMCIYVHIPRPAYIYTNSFYVFLERENEMKNECIILFNNYYSDTCCMQPCM